MSHARTIAEAVLLGLAVLFCWLGVIGMLRMREPMQALHYLSLPACASSFLVAAAVFVQSGSTQAFWKTLVIAFLLLGSNSAVTHASARAFRTRELGHWEPHPEDGVEFVPVPEEQS